MSKKENKDQSRWATGPRLVFLFNIRVTLNTPLHLHGGQGKDSGIRQTWQKPESATRTG